MLEFLGIHSFSDFFRLLIMVLGLYFTISTVFLIPWKIKWFKEINDGKYSRKYNSRIGYIFPILRVLIILIGDIILLVQLLRNDEVALNALWLGVAIFAPRLIIKYFGKK